MKALLPQFCRPMGYVILILSLFLPFILFLTGMINDNNLLFYKECTKLLMIMGCLMILMAISKKESIETEMIRVTAIRRAVFITVIIIFFTMLYKVAIRDITSIDSASFLIFLIINVICLEYGMKKADIDKILKK